jgi:hypothetical protein
MSKKPFGQVLNLPAGGIAAIIRRLTGTTTVAGCFPKNYEVITNTPAIKKSINPINTIINKMSFKLFSK